MTTRSADATSVASDSLFTYPQHVAWASEDEPSAEVRLRRRAAARAGRSTAASAPEFVGLGDASEVANPSATTDPKGNVDRGRELLTFQDSLVTLTQKYVEARPRGWEP